MIRVFVQNFQSLRDVEVVINGLTVVTGSNNAGKSALLRAIYSACINARGTHFVRKGAKHASVRLVFEDGEFTWEKGARDNRYVVNGLVIDKVAHGAPKEVQDFGIRAIQSGNLSIWPQIAHQNEGGVFLFNQSGAVMAEAVADVDRVGLLTKALRLGEQEARSIQEQLKIRKADLVVARKRRSLLDGLPEVEARFALLEESQGQVVAKQKALAELRVMKVRRDRLAELIGCLDRVVGVPLPSQEDVDEVKKAHKKSVILHQVQEQWVSLSRYVARWGEVAASVEILQERPFRTTLDNLKAKRGALQALLTQQREMVRIEGRIQEDDASIARLKKEREDLRPAVCPVCQRPMEDASCHL